MGARLFCKTGKTRGLELELTGDREATVGRDPASDLAIERPLMSSRHARIFYDDDAGRFVLEDLDSLNGTELDGDRVTGSERLGHLHVITFAGSYDFFFHDPERYARRHPEPAEPSQIAEATPEPAEPGKPAAAGPAAAGPAGDKDEVTSIESEPAVLPGFLARRADAVSDPAEPAGKSTTPSEITSIEHEPIALPNFLARRADQARADKPTDAPPVDAPPVDAPPVDGPPAADTEEAGAKADKTLHEKLPVALPGILARRSEEVAGKEEGQHHPNVQKHETVDLSQIEDLITAEEEALRGSGGAEPTEGLQLIVTESGGQVRQYPLVEGENLVGRGGAVQVALKYPDLSRRHARLTVAGETVTLRDLASRNRTFVDDKPIEPQVDIEVEPGVRLRFGSVEARLAKVGG